MASRHDLSIDPLPLSAALPPAAPPPAIRPPEAALAYDAVGAGYRAYADGDVAEPFAFAGAYGFADRAIWTRIEAALVALRADGRDGLRLIDAGCGPGTWLVRTAIRARELGFTRIEGWGFDISPEMIVLAAGAARGLCDSRIALHFAVADIAEALAAHEGAPFDLTLCLYGVLNHLPAARHEGVAFQLARVTAGTLIVTVRSVGSLPSIYVEALDRARAFHQDNDADRLEIDLVDGRHIGFSSHLFCAAELRAIFAPHARIAELSGIDLFHSRFAPNRHWNPAIIPGAGFDAALERLERVHAHDPAFIDRAAHILLVGAVVPPAG
jgi:SAM-dependent methyltransferase